ncbi:hypothetical protein ABK040_016608 [Willaertia magna]
MKQKLNRLKKKSTDVISLILNDPNLSQYIPHITIEYLDENNNSQIKSDKKESKEDKNKLENENNNFESSQINEEVEEQKEEENKKFKTIPFTERAKIPKLLIQKIKLDRHIIWEKGNQIGDAFVPINNGSNQQIKLIDKLIDLTFDKYKWKSLPNTLTNINQLDSCIKQFLIDGYLIISPEMITTITKDFHSEILQLAQRSNYKQLPASHFHLSQRGRKDQHWHKDNFEFNGYIRPTVPYNPDTLINIVKDQKLITGDNILQLHHIMAMYYAQDTVLEMGPTGIRKNSHYTNYCNDYIPDRFVFDMEDKGVRKAMDNNEEFREMSLVCRAGSIAILHYDLVHRRMRNDLTDRFMIKFQFKRTIKPEDDPYLKENEKEKIPFDEVPIIDNDYDKRVEPIAKECWNWIHNIN